MMQDPRPGVYRHYKGNLYQVLEVATHSETRERLVVYRPLYGERALWVRPLAMFVEDVVVDGVLVPRFAWQYAAAPEEASSKVASMVTSGAAALASTGQGGAADGSRPGASAVPGRASSRGPETASTVAPGSLDERIHQAMSSAHDKPDFSSVPLFDHPATAIKVGVTIAAVVLLLVWLL